MQFTLFFDVPAIARRKLPTLWAGTRLEGSAISPTSLFTTAVSPTISTNFIVKVSKLRHRAQAHYFNFVPILVMLRSARIGFDNFGVVSANERHMKLVSHCKKTGK